MKKEPNQELDTSSSRFSFLGVCNNFPEKRLFAFQKSDDSSVFLTGKNLVHNVNALGAALREKAMPGEKALVVLPQGLDYICSLLACFENQVVAVPVPVADSIYDEQILGKTAGILEDAQAVCIITNTDILQCLKKEQFSHPIALLDVNEAFGRDVAGQVSRPVTPDDTALLLYTSGSTAQPKGVVISYGNLIAQARRGAAQWGIDHESRILSWMPQFHNFGLHFNILSPLLKGAASVILQPNSFIRNPASWFEAIDRYQATHIAAPNFAFDYCCATIDPARVQGCSLGSLQAIICGGEPVRKETCERFTAAFKRLGVRRNVFCPHYGLSETGSVATKAPGQPLRFLSLDIQALEENRIKHTKRKTRRRFVSSCGEIGEGVAISIVNPDTCEPRVPDKVGEIWVKSAAVATGYFNDDNETTNTFSGTIESTGESGFLRTGDLGFVENNHLYIVGRIKEVMIVHGKNHHPVDIEWTIRKTIPDLTLPVAVFSCDIEQHEKVVVVQEIEGVHGEQGYAKTAREIVSAISETHALVPYDVVLTEKGAIPKTGIGKIQRKACRNAYRDQTLPVLFRYRHGDKGRAYEDAQPVVDGKRRIIEVLKNEIVASAIDIDPVALAKAATLSELGLDSIQYVRISGRIEEVYNIAFEPVLLFKYSDFETLAQYLATQIAGSDNRHAAPGVLRRNKPEIQTPVVHDDAGERDIAIIGMSCHFPGGAADPEAFWDNLINRRDCIAPVGTGRPLIVEDYRRNYGEPDIPFPQWGGFIDDVDTFDARFFGVSPLEAECMDPQQRKVLELVWNVIEHGGYNPRQLTGRDVGVFVGVHNSDYAELLARHPALADIYGAYLDSGLHMSMIANRVSRWFNFHGPSEVVNTACSSSLVAVHHAVTSIYRGESSLAIAGGINLLLTPRIYLASHNAGMLAGDGRCKTFDHKANGFVRAEGYGAVLLKPYRQAVRDRDVIHGVIKGTAVNHDGHSTSLRAPSLDAQKQLVKSAYQASGLAVESIGYIEAHGTGTSLGDPVEIRALQEAFQDIGADLPSAFCGLGTVKTNIGHCEAAAGIAGLIKVLLSLKHRTLPGIVHFERLNPYIALQDSPFYIVEHNQEWRRLRDSAGREMPLRAGISSFGFGGVNAHLIVEEYDPARTVKKSTPVAHGTHAAVIVLSANDEASLHAYGQRLLAFVDRAWAAEQASVDVLDMAYTLQVGRGAMDWRVAFVVKDVPELIRKLTAFVQGREDIAGCWRGQINYGPDAPLLEDDEDAQALARKWIATGKLDKIAQLWVQGGRIEWGLLYGATQPRRIGLPTYPFARERYWIPENDMGTAQAEPRAAMTALHPLLHRNTSDLSGQRFSSRFTGQEFFLADHVVNGQRVLPGVACLEMAITAVAQSVDGATAAGVELKNVVWVRPVVVGEKQTDVHIGLYPEDNGDIAFEIYSAGEAVDGEPIIHSQGSAELRTPAAPPALDVSALRAQCRPAALSADRCYRIFKDMGLNYGAALRGIEDVYVAPDHLLAKLALPACVAATREQFTLHPSVLDSALQASLGVLIDNDGQTESSAITPALPFALASLAITGQSGTPSWALIRRNDSSAHVQHFDIDLCDDQGTVCVQLKGFATRPLKRHATATLLAQPSWHTRGAATDITAPDYTRHWVVLCEPDPLTSSSLEHALPGARVLVLQREQTGIDARFQHHALRLFEEIQTLLKANAKGNVLIQVVVFNQGDRTLLSGLTGLLKTAHLENPQLIGQLIEYQDEPPPARLIARLKDDSRAPDRHIRYANGIRQVAGWDEVDLAPRDITPAWQDRGVYLITGGAGGLGLILARAIAGQAKDTTLILTGRSALSDAKQSQLASLRTQGATVEYRQVDVSDSAAVTDLIHHILHAYNALHGIIHSAGVIRDNFLLNKTAAEWQAVLAPKVSGVVNLDEASRDIALDFFMLFSSIAGGLGNAGQADYASANAFMDAYAGYRNGRVASGQRQGHTVSINWPLWEDGGMRLDAATEQLVRERLGLSAMTTETGLRVIDQALTQGVQQLMVLEGDRGRLQSLLCSPPIGNDTSPPPHAVEANSGAAPASGVEQLEEKTTDYFKQLLSAIIKLPVDKIDADAALEDYGIDSVMIMRLTGELEKTFGSLSKTLFFEYRTIAELTAYFLDEYRAQLIALLGIEAQAQAPAANAGVAATMAAHAAPALTSRRRTRFAPAPVESPQDTPGSALDIAIIGVSGRYPQARNLQAYWENLRDGKDCITEVPGERWDWREYYTEDRSSTGCHYSKWGGFIDDVDKFDPMFFNILPREAAFMDPQERLFIEHVWTALEDAGYRREDLQQLGDDKLPAKVGVYAAAMYSEYQLFGAEASLNGDRKGFAGISATIANRVSYAFDLHGPSMTVDSMCSGSLTALHLACQDLRHGRTRLGIAGGVNVSIHPNKYLMLSSGQFISTAGRCESFGKGGDGYIPGEGVGVVLLKRREDAERDGDHIYGVIKGSALNHGGKTNGYTVPNPKMQQQVIAAAVAEARVDPRTVSYLEAHGTGTVLGDPIEITGLTQAFGARRQDGAFCRIGSVKSNIGHCESAAGVAGVTKVLLQMRYGKIVPSLHSRVLNPHIDFSSTPFVVNQALCDWERPVVDGKAYPRIAGISSFGAGGSNAHIVIEEYIPQDRERRHGNADIHRFALIALSAKNDERLQAYANRLIDFLNNDENPDLQSPDALADIAYTLQTGREAMDMRLAVLAVSIGDLREKLMYVVAGDEDVEGVYRGGVKQNKEALAAWFAEDNRSAMPDAWIVQRNYPELAQLWVKGFNVDWQTLYDGDRPRRISLPTYPFKGDRYWHTQSRRPEIDAEVLHIDRDRRTEVRHARVAARSPEKTAPVENAQQKGPTKHSGKPAGISLVNRLSMPDDYAVSAPSAKKRRLSLADCGGVGDGPQCPVAEPPVKVREHGDGIFEINVADPENNNVLSGDIVGRLRESLQKTEDRDDAKVVLLTGSDSYFLSDKGGEQITFDIEKLCRLIAELDIPAIAVMKGNSVGLGWLVGVFCDFMVCGRESSYRYHPAGRFRVPGAQERLFVCQRVGEGFGAELLYSGAGYTGQDLDEKSIGIPVLPKRDVDAYAMQMARDLAQSPRDALCQLKRHLRSDTRHLTHGLFQHMDVAS